MIIMGILGYLYIIILCDKQSGIFDNIYKRRISNMCTKSPGQHLFSAVQATLSLLSFGTVALPALTLYPGVLNTLPIST